ncbi:MAG: cyclic nucleotide-binding domain-containing protein [Geminicoccaceae bacterium]
MAVRTYAAGEILVRQGDASDCAIFIRKGEVEVYREGPQGPIPLGRVGELDYVGEMGVLEDRERIATVRAVGEVEAELIDREDFLDRVRDNGKLAHRLVLRLSARLRDVDMMLEALQGGGRAAVAEAPAGLPALQLEADSLAAKLYAGNVPILITELPYTVGRRAGPREPNLKLDLDLEVADPEPYRLSRPHFAILMDRGELCLRDLGSELGTLVDDVGLGRELASDRIVLTPGTHRIIAGGRGSPYMFKLKVG